MLWIQHPDPHSCAEEQNTAIRINSESDAALPLLEIVQMIPSLVMYHDHRHFHITTLHIFTLSRQYSCCAQILQSILHTPAAEVRFSNFPCFINFIICNVFIMFCMQRLHRHINCTISKLTLLQSIIVI